DRKYAYAALLSFENGKNRSEAMADVDEAADLLRWYAAEMIRNQGYEHTMGQFLPGESARAMLKPYGVWAVVAPFNFPFAIADGRSRGLQDLYARASQADHHGDGREESDDRHRERGPGEGRHWGDARRVWIRRPEVLGVFSGPRRPHRQGRVPRPTRVGVADETA